MEKGGGVGGDNWKWCVCVCVWVEGMEGVCVCKTRVSVHFVQNISLQIL